MIISGKIYVVICENRQNNFEPVLNISIKTGSYVYDLISLCCITSKVNHKGNIVF